ncbi:class I SAM-dependent methyltransferase [Azospirillum isscasi]|uniref:Class I SAM-dependent methyltransferase n=1 Tax=Azospirillum isscasi TaxID=3053926 RepID=A0ABU0WJE2_9PROT|nr:class I SAM-dependent methyltransferase [Azospirillum isscasi]MDQ2104343.1 class I SAM-dependent methyltransferase [Azospirillum isscasi]
MLHRYVRTGHRRVDGWLSRLDALLIASVGRWQSAQGVVGSVGEIGVHHGRLFILLALLRKADERAFAVDLFDDQQFNVDQSGQGDETAFRNNLVRFGIAPASIEVVRGNSLDLAWAGLSGRLGPSVRLFSIDGGHTAEITRHDLGIADDSLGDGGVIVLDDYFNPEFPAVSEGMCRFMAERPGALAPFAIGDNKLLLARPDWAGRYRGMLADAVPSRHFVRDTELFGQPVTVFRTPRTPMQFIRQTGLTRRLRSHPLGRALKPIIRRFVQG